MTRIIVTGGAGFLGSHLCTHLIAAGHEVLCVDDFSSGQVRNIAHLLDHDIFSLLEHDIVTPFEAEATTICNFACPASPVHYQADPVQTLLTSVNGTLNLLALARRQGATLLQASTSEVYGDPEVHPQPEAYLGNVDPTGPRACYDEGKRCAEALCFDYQRKHGVPVKVARIFNTYGPNMGIDDGRVIPNFIVQALTGAPLTLYGDGDQTRSFCYVDDLVEALLALLGAETIAGPVNLGNPEEVTMRDLAERIVALTGSRSSIVAAPLPEGDPRRRRPDIAQARQLLDWQPRTSLDDGLIRTIAHFERLLGEDGPLTRQLQQSRG